MPPRRFSDAPKEGGRDRRDRGRDHDKDEKDSPRSFRKKTCRFCADKTLPLDYKDARAMRPFLTEREKILPRRMTGMCAYHQRRVTEAIKRGRVLGLLPFSVEQRESL